MSFRSLSIGALVGLAVFFPSLGAASQSADDGAFSVESSRYRVELIAWERYGHEYASVRFRFHLQDKDSGSETVFTVDNATTALDSGEIGNDVLLLVGDVQGLATGLTLVDLRGAEVQDFYLSYGGDLSPDGTTLVFVKFYPRTVPPEEQTVVLNAVDLTDGADAVRGRRIVALYPQAPSESDGGPSPTAKTDRRHQILTQAGFLWLEEPRRVVFLDVTSGAPWLVVADLSRGLSEPRIERRPVDVGEILKPPPGSQRYERLLEQESAFLSAVGLRQGPPGKVVIELAREQYRQGVFRVTELTMDLPTDGPQDAAGAADGSHSK